MKPICHRKIFCLLAFLLGIWTCGVLYFSMWVPYAQSRNGVVQGSMFDCPDNFPVKGNIASMIYHVPGSRYYSMARGWNSVCFDTPERAQQNGFRAPLSP